MKLGAVVLSIIFTVMNMDYAIAGGRHGHYYNNHYRGYGHHYKNHHHGHRHHYKSRHRSRGHYSYVPRRYYSHYNSHGDHTAYALGGLVVGGILGATLTNSYTKGIRYSNYSKSVYVNPSLANNKVQPSYVMQPNGICYVVSQVNNGNLVLSPVSPGNCQ